MPLAAAVRAALLDSLFGSGSPSAWDIALSTGQPHDNGTLLFEPPAGVGYRRVSVPNDPAHWPTTADRKTNGHTITFPVPTGVWGVIGWFCILNHDTGRFLLWQGLAVDMYIDRASAPPSFAPGTLAIGP